MYVFRPLRTHFDFSAYQTDNDQTIPEEKERGINAYLIDPEDGFVVADEDGEGSTEESNSDDEIKDDNEHNGSGEAQMDDWLIED